MKKNIVKKLITGALAVTLVIGSLTGCGAQKAESVASTASDAVDSKGGTIMWLANVSFGISFEAAKSYAEDVCNSHGYDFKVVYGDSFNDPAGNLKAVQDAMTDDVVGLVTSQDGGIGNIMDEYPDLYVFGFNSDMNGVFGEGEVATSAKCLENEKFLGTVADMHVKGEDFGKDFFDMVIENGYKRVATMTFPAYAYPTFAAGDATFRQLVDEYNETAADADKIEVVGDVHTIEFAPLEESYFLEKEHQNLDCIIGLVDGASFIYPAMRAAVDAGNCSQDTKLLTLGMTDDAAVDAEIGDGLIRSTMIAPAEDIGLAITMLDKAITGKMYEDYSEPEQIDGMCYVIDSKEDIENVLTKSLNGTADSSLAQVTIDDLQAVTSYTDLKALFMSEQLKVDALADR